MFEARDIRVFGIVQGVGFRPFVYRLATGLGLRGWVRNTSGDVIIHVEGEERTLDCFQERLVREAPPLARIEGVAAQESSVIGGRSFTIEPSEAGARKYQPISPDVAVCADCLRELQDPSDRRYLYPFINCTNCGPRYTIIVAVPYDRENTTMRCFAMCSDCRAEYEDPSDRRFHAQPVACPKCGPHLWLEVGNDRHAGNDYDVVSEAGALLSKGKIVAIKGLGGFHLAVDASNDVAVLRLRQRKARPHKPFAVMARDLDTVRRVCNSTPEAERLLCGPRSPIVLLPRRRGSLRLVSREVAPDHDTLGVMLPYTPLHHMLLHCVGKPLVMTSGNVTEEPLAVDNEEAREKLGHIADAFLMHDRPIHMPCDDSVAAASRCRQDGSATFQIIRRARGYAPEPVCLGVDGPQVLAVGPEMKATIAVARDRLAFVSQHIGDLWNEETWRHYLRIVGQFEDLFHVEPEVIAHDLHPDYLSTRYAKERASKFGLAVVEVQHHHAHALSCLAEAGIDPREEPVLAVVFDGTGYGVDGRIWGGEWLLLRSYSYERLAHLQYMPLVGGDAAIRHVDRLAAAYLLASEHKLGAMAQVPCVANLGEEVLEMLRVGMSLSSVPLTSSMGRLFDVVAAMLSLASESTYEAQAAIRLEAAARRASGTKARAPYPWSVSADGEVDIRAMLHEIAADVVAGSDAGKVALRFHETVAEMVARLSADLAGTIGARRVVLSGGCFQNTLLTSLCVNSLESYGLQAIVHAQVPCNDGGVALGQALAARLAYCSSSPRSLSGSSGWNESDRGSDGDATRPCVGVTGGEGSISNS